MNETFEQCRKNLLRRGFEVRIAATTEEARQILREEIRAAAPETISFGGSMTMEATGIVDELRREGRYRLFDGVDYTLPPEERIEIRRQGLLADLYISGINAITEEGALYWLDGIGNRVAAIAFGPRKVLLVAGRNKIVATRAAAEARIRDIAAPRNVARLGQKTPCAATGVCADCDSEGRICNTADGALLSPQADYRDSDRRGNGIITRNADARRGSIGTPRKNDTTWQRSRKHSSAATAASKPPNGWDAAPPAGNGTHSPKR